MNVYEKLRAIQVELKAPKSRTNTFGKYRYRSMEDICEAVKPLLDKYGCTVFLQDEIDHIGDRYYITASATFVDCEEGKSIEIQAKARETDNKAGMDAAQVTGTASSYARKYALNGLFLIDDTKDADSDEYSRQTGKEASAEAKKAFIDKCKDAGKDYKEILANVGWIEGHRVTEAQLLDAMELLKK